MPGRQLWPAVRLIPCAEPAKGKQSSAGQLWLLLRDPKAQRRGVRRCDERVKGSADEEEEKEGRERFWGEEKGAACYV